MFNKVILIGRLGQNAEAKTAQNNKEYVILNIATQESWKNDKGDYENRTEWHRVFVWRNLSKFAKTLQKGQLITLEGTLRYREVEDEIEGTTFKHRISEIHAISMKRLSKIEAADDRQTEPATSNRRPSVDGVRTSPHPPFVVKIEAGCEIEETQIRSMSALLGLSHCINREPFPATSAFFRTDANIRHAAFSSERLSFRNHMSVDPRSQQLQYLDVAIANLKGVAIGFQRDMIVLIGSICCLR